MSASSQLEFVQDRPQERQDWCVRLHGQHQSTFQGIMHFYDARVYESISIHEHLVVNFDQ